MTFKEICHGIYFPKLIITAKVKPLSAPHGTDIQFRVNTGADMSILSKHTYIHSFQDQNTILDSTTTT